MRSMAFIHARCLEDGDCLRWAGPVSGQCPKLCVRTGEGEKTKTLQPRRLVWEEVNGPIPPKRYVTPTCGDPLCLNPEHLKLTTRGQIVRKVAQRPDTRTRRHLGGLKRREASDRTIEMARYIRESPKSGAELARETGIPPTTISAIRLNKRWRETYASPFAGLGA
jgi:hypothetical protein